MSWPGVERSGSSIPMPTPTTGACIAPDTRSVCAWARAAPKRRSSPCRPGPTAFAIERRSPSPCRPGAWRPCRPARGRSGGESVRSPGPMPSGPSSGSGPVARRTSSPRTARRLLRVEIETNGGPTPELADFVGKMRDACGLTPASVSKFEAGLLARGLAPERSLDLGSSEISSESSVEELAFAVLRQHFAALLRKEGGTRLGEDPEQLHDMRVATRRIRAAIALFEAALPAEVVMVREELGWVASALGAVRDLDVLIEQVETWRRRAEGLDDRALGAVAGVLSADRDQARANLVQTLDSPRYERLLAELTSVLRHGPVGASPFSRAPAVDAAPSLIKQRYRKVRKGGRRIDRTSKPADYHRLRIRAKRLRYALQFLAPIYGTGVTTLIRRTVRLQDLLGAHQDAEVAVARFEAIVAEEGSDLPPAAAFAMGEIAERFAKKKAKLRRRFPKLFRRVGGSAWADVRRVMKRAAS